MYIGLPQWQHPAWNRIGLRDLADYSRYFNCVEGNTTFYALPKLEIVQRWRDMTTDDFRFCFKFPATISHKAALRNCDADLQAFLPLSEPGASAHRPALAATACRVWPGGITGDVAIL